MACGFVCGVKCTIDLLLSFFSINPNEPAGFDGKLLSATGGGGGKVRTMMKVP